MAEYIEREAVLALLEDPDRLGYLDASDIKSVPAEDVARVVHGRWIQKDSRNPFSWRTCSECGCVVTAAQARVYVGCPKCLARMDGE